MRSRVLYSRLASDKKGPVAALSLLTKNMVLCVWQGYGGGGSDDNIQTAWTTHTRRVDRVRALSRCVVTTKNRDDNVHAGVCVCQSCAHTHTHTLSLSGVFLFCVCAGFFESPRTISLPFFWSRTSPKVSFFYGGGGHHIIADGDVFRTLPASLRESSSQTTSVRSHLRAFAPKSHCRQRRPLLESVSPPHSHAAGGRRPIDAPVPRRE